LHNAKWAGMPAGVAILHDLDCPTAPISKAVTFA
jgi:hypothetical protein